MIDGWMDVFKPFFKSLLLLQFCPILTNIGTHQGDHLSGKPGNVREFDSCQGNVRDFTKNREMSEKTSCQRKVA